jgi:hypothetical protein
LLHQSGSPSSTTFNPTSFKLEKYIESYSGKGDWYAISGGIPNDDWTKVVKQHQFNPNQCHPLDNYQQSKMLLEKRMTDKFKAGDNLTQFKNNMVEYFVMHGIDTITHLPDLL